LKSRKQQKLLGIAVAMISFLLVDFSLSEKLVGFLFKPDVLSGVLSGNFSKLAHFLFLSFWLLTYCIAVSNRHRHAATAAKERNHGAGMSLPIRA
jgi:hypothetical protein